MTKPPNARAMAGEFEIEGGTANALKPRHVTTGHRFTFRVSNPNKRPGFLRRDYSPGHPSSRSVREEIEKAAHAFAECEARKGG
jgi:hypothetical protein